jgi:hypothetical protein
MSTRPDKRFLIAVLIFGIVSTAAGIRWLASGSIEIGQGQGYSGRAPIAAQPQANKPVAGRIDSGDLLFYPLCATWIALGSSMTLLSVCAFFSVHEMYARLAAYTCALILPLGFATVGVALWHGP